MKILGLGGSSHDFSACLLIDGEIKYAIEEERISRIKHSLDVGNKLFRCRAVDYLLEAASLSIDDIDHIVGNDIIDPRYYIKYNHRINLINHHLAHAASAFYCSPFEEAAILVIDGFGSAIDNMGEEYETITYYVGKKTEISELKKIAGSVSRKELYPSFQNSLGAFYLAITRAIGFEFLQEGKTMGLSAYGKDTYVDEFKSCYMCDSEGGFIFTEAQKEAMIAIIKEKISKAKNQDEEFQIKADIAYAGQYHLENVFVKVCNYLYKITGLKNICLAGGVALNSVANFKIIEKTPFEHIFVQAAAGDNGTSIGSALYAYYNIFNDKETVRQCDKSIFTPYLGKKYEENSIKEVLNKYGDRIEIISTEDILRDTAELLAQGKILGFFNGRSEIGPRALGNRSILANPRIEGMKDTINARIKHREPFRPFAPIVLEERQEDYFHLKNESYYMLLVPPILKEKQQEIPSVTHVDGSGRVQTVSNKLNPKLHSLLTIFNEITGTPILLNTSFNDNGEPIVESPEDAIKCFLNIDLDYLVLEEYLLKKR